MTTSIQKNALLSKFSALAYKNEEFLRNSANLPAGWSLAKADESSPPFAAFAFKNDATSEVVVAYRGTDGLTDGAADAAIFAGRWDKQFQQGIDFAAKVQGDPVIFPAGTDPSKLLVTGHSLGGAIAQITAQAYGLDGSAIDPGAAARIVQTAEFREAALAAGLPPEGRGAAATFSNYLVAGSVVSNGTGDHIGETSYLPSLTFSTEQALTAFLLFSVNPVAGVAYAIGTDQFVNKHPSTQVSQALVLLAGSQDGTAPEPGAIKLQPKIIGFFQDQQNNEIKPRYSQTEFEVRDATTGVLQSTVRFSGSGADRMIEEFDAKTGALQSRTTLTSTGTVTVRPITGGSVELSYLPDATTVQPDAAITTKSKDAENNVIASSSTKVFDDGSSLTTTQLPGDATRTTSRNAQNQVTETRQTESVAGRTISRSYNGAGQLQSTAVTTGNVAEGFTTTTSYENGSSVKVVQRPNGSVESTTGIVAPVASLGAAVQDLNSLVQAIRSGQPLPILSSGLRLLNTQVNPVIGPTQIINNQPLFTTTAVAGAVASVYGLYQAFQNGNALDQVSASANALVAVDSAVKAITGEATGILSQGVAESVGQAIPFLGAAVSLANGDYTGAAVAVIAAATSLPVIGWIYAAYSIIVAINSEPPEVWGTARFKFADGTMLTVDAAGEGMGIGKVEFLMKGDGKPANNADGTPNTQHFSGLLGYLNDVIARSTQGNADTELGIIPQRLPQLSWRESRQDNPGYSVVEIDPLTGEQRYPELRYNDDFTPINADATDPAQRRDVFERMVDSALSRQAIAPMWEVRTARLQQDTGNPDAGLTEEERDAKHGLAASADVNGKRIPGKFRPVVLDLNGDGVISTVTNAASSVSFDWDDSGYVKQTGWVGAGEGFLVLDRNLNGAADSGKELFSNGLVSDAAKGVRSMAWVDANADGVIDANDPVFAALSVWQDTNQDGVQDAGETHTLASLGITQLDYNSGRFTRNGQDFAMQSPDLETSNDGVRINTVQGGIQVDYSNGRSTLFVSQVIDLGGGAGQGTNFIVRDDGITSWEDGISPGNPSDPAYPHAQTPTANQAISILIAQLLANDAFNGSNAGLSVTAIGSVTRGAASLNVDQGTVEFTPEHNYVGQASFEYTVTAPNGQTRVAHALIDLRGVNDAPSVSVSIPNRSIFGYGATETSVTVGSGESSYSTVDVTIDQGIPFYAPYETVAGQLIGYEYAGESGYETRGPLVDTRIPKAYADKEYARLASQQSNDGGPLSEVRIVIGGLTYAIAATPSTYLHSSPIAVEASDSGQVSATDPDSNSGFRYEIAGQGLYGTAKINKDTGAFDYIGKRYATQDAQGNPVNQNVDTNDHLRTDEQFTDVFKVKVVDLSDPTGKSFTTQDVSVVHYGPRPSADVASGGKKPIAIDLNGDGFHFTNVDDSNVFYDVNGDGWRRKIAWNNPNDGFIAYDKNGDGKIDRFDEISFVPYKPDGQTDLEGLRAFDTNGDGVFSAADAKWNSFGVWQDANSNGITDPGEFKSLTDLGINAISLTSDGHFQVINGQSVHGVGSATKTDGTTLALADVTLKYRNVTQGTASNGATVTATVAPFSTGQVFNGTAGADLVFGTAGSDQYHMGDGNDVVNDDAGDDLVEAGAGDDIVFTGSGKDFVDAGAGNDSVFTGDGDDLAVGGAGDDFLSMGAGNDVAFGGDGNDLLSGGSGNDLLSGDGGDDKLFGEGGWDVLFGMAGDDELWGGDGNDQLHGGAGNDLLAGGAGDDTMDGGIGNDTYEVDTVGDVVIEKPGEGFDTVRASINYTLATDLENLTLIGTDALTGTGNASDNVMFGNDAANTLIGLEGNDTLDGGQGADVLIGGTGNDTYVIDNVGDVVVELAGEGIDMVKSRITMTLGSNVENLTLIGINAINGTGNSLDNVITGNGAANRIDGGAGADRMVGSAGNDTYVVESVGDVVVENALEGNDTVEASINYVLGTSVENLILRGGATQGTGNELDNAITANDLGDVLSGGGGSDILIGGAGADRLDGGTGADFMAGGGGNDTYVVDNIGDVITEQVGQGADTVEAAVSFTLGANFENLTLTGASNLDATGNELANILLGNAGNNRLDGGLGADTMAGGAGDDTYIVDSAGEVVTEAANAGSDTVLSAVNYVLGANVENLTLTGSAALAAGNELANAITANDLGDSLSGLAGDDTLTGGAGNDTLDGGAGADVVRGGKGDDLYVVDNAGDQVIENSAEGIDSVRASIDYVLGANVENLTLVGGAYRANGNDLANVLTANDLGNTLSGGVGSDTLVGGAGNDTLDGGSDADTMRGGAGNDSYVVDNAGDQVIELAIQGVDRVTASIDYTLTQNVEQLTLTGASIRGTGNDLANLIVGNASANVLDGGAGADTLQGGAGNDTYIVDNTGDLVIENATEGIDTVQSSVSYGLAANVENLTLTGTANIDASGNDLANVLVGNAGNNRLDGGAGADTMSGGAGDDSYVVDNAGDVVTEQAGQGADTVEAAVSFTLGANVENVTLTGASNLDAAGNELANILLGNAGNNRLDGGFGADTMAGGAGDDTYVVDSVGDLVTETANAGIDTVLSAVNYALGANVENLTLTGGAIQAAGNELANAIIANDLGDSLSGLAGDDMITGGAGNDMLDGGAGADVMGGGEGDDLYFVDNVGDQVIELAGQGIDRVAASVDYTLTQDVEHLELTGSAVRGTGNELANTLVGNGLANVLDGGAGADVLHGGAGNDTYIVDNAGDLVIENATEGIDTVQSSVSHGLTANVENLTLTGASNLDGAGNELANLLLGNAGNNRLDGGFGADTMAGGAGDDTYVVDSVGDLVTETANAGNDTVLSAVNYALGANVENLTLTGSATQATGNELANAITANDLGDSLSGLAGDDTLTGGVGNDMLDGGAGADVMRGGKGDDLYVVDNNGDQVIESSAEGIDSVRSSIDYALGTNVENLMLTGGASRATGNDLANVLTANDLGNTLSGGAGSDTLIGGAGNDTLDGGSDVDTMRGGAGNDSYVVDNVGDQVVELAGQGVDRVSASIDYTLTQNVEQLTLTAAATRGTGNDLANLIVGNASANILDGVAGADTLQGGAGDDLYIVDNVGDLVVENTGEGTDTVQAAVSYALAASVENLTLTGTANTDATGNGLSNTLIGNAGNNRLDGGAGADAMSGGAGDDSYVVDNAGDQVIESLGQGFDRVSASIDYVLPQNVEQLTLTGAAIRATGNNLDNLLFGNDQANILDGSAGADQMAGGLGDDLYVVDNIADVVTEAANAGTDLVQSSVTYTLAANVENLTLTGTANIDGIGNAAANALTGNAGNNRLDGGAGADTMTGGAGDDSYVVDNVGDQVVELANQGVDRVSASIDYVLTQNVEQLTLTGTAICGTGNDLANLLFGNDQANILDGKAGADQMAGGLGDDRYVVDNAADTVTEALNAGTDTVLASVTYSLSANVENLALTGTAAINGTGNELANVLVGNSGANVLSAGAGNDVLAGGLGNDALDGGGGDDLYLYNQGEGRDTITDASGTDTVRFGAGITLDSVAARTVTVNGQTKVFISVLGTDGTEQQDQGIEIASTGGVERFEFANGTVSTLSDLMITSRALNGDYQNNTLTGDRRDDTINAGAGNDIVYARTGNDIVYGGSGADKLFGEGGNDKLFGESEADQLWGGAGNDYLDGGSGNDQLVGGTGDDQLYGGVDSDVLDGGDGVDYLNGDSGEDQLFGGAGNDTLDGGVDADLLASGDGDDVIHGGSGWNVVVAGAGNDAIDTGTDRDFIDAGAGNDTITTDTGSDFIAGGKGNDMINTGIDHDLMAFNRGDGADIVVGSGWDRDTVSLGGGIRYTDLSLRKVGNDLVFDVAQGDSITFKDWYTGSARRSVDTLQMVTVGGDYSTTSTDRMKNRKIVSFDFEQLANRFDAVRAANPSLTSWPVASELNNYFKASSDTQAIGGDLAYRYATTGSYGDLDWMGVRNRMAGMTGTAWQSLTTSTTVNPWTALQAGISLIVDQTAGLPSPINPAASPSSDELIFAAINAGGRKPTWMGSQPAPVLP